MKPDSWENRTGGKRIHYRHISVASSRAFAEALRRLMRDWGYEPAHSVQSQDFMAHLRAEMDPPRIAPFAPCIFKALMTGELLPDTAMIDACIRMGNEKHDDALEEMLNACESNAGIRPGAAREACNEIAGLLKMDGKNGAKTLAQTLQDQTELRGVPSMLRGARRLNEPVVQHLRQLIDTQLEKQPLQRKQAHDALHRAITSSQPDVRKVAQATEFSVLLRHCLEHGVLDQPKTAAALYHSYGIGSKGKKTIQNAEKSLTHSTLCGWSTGNALPPPFVVSALADLFSHDPAIAVDARLLAPVYDELRLRKATELWQEAEAMVIDKHSHERAGQPGLLLKACRIRYGASADDFAGDFCHSNTWLSYERDARRFDTRASIGIPSNRESRAEVMDHLLQATAAAADRYSNSLGLPPRPWLLDENGAGLGRQTSMPLPEKPLPRGFGTTSSKEVAMAQDRVRTLRSDFVRSETLNNDQRDACRRRQRTGAEPNCAER